MKGYIAFCPHFHQPHFQLHKTREEAFLNSYQPWLELLQQAVKLEKFYINLHFSGPFLYWFKDQKSAYMNEFKKLLASRKLGIVGGLADEPFIQLSSRTDDYLYQLKKYAELCGELTGVSAADWQGIHLVERECGEALLTEVSRAAGLIGALPLYYLDAETFYQSHYAKPGGAADYCLKHFGFKDPFSLTTIAHLPPEMLYYALRDEINGQAFYSVPVHTQYRYQLLKRNGFTPEDKTRVKPAHYLFYIKDALEKAYRLSAQYGRELDPIVLIFEDAEKMGQWSKDPQGDKAWLMEFFQLVERDDELEFTGLRNYLERVGFLDSYPVSSSHSYPEWENWTAKRGIRGVTWGDERLRRVISRLRILEEEQSAFEKILIGANCPGQSTDRMQAMLERALLQSIERFEIVTELLEKNYSPAFCEYYSLINRVRNLIYQEDPKWASRHPCYGSSPYYDMQGLAYLEIAERLLIYLRSQVEDSQPTSQAMAVKDWDFDGRDEIILNNQSQTVAIDLEGACIQYHHVLAASLGGDYARMAGILQNDFAAIKAYHSVYRYAYPLVMTEADSSLKREIFPEGARKENCRNSMRCELMSYEDGVYQPLGGLDQALFTMEGLSSEADLNRVSLCCTKQITSAGQEQKVSLSKEFLVYPDKLAVIIKASIEGDMAKPCFLVPQIVSSAAPSDEVDFCPVSWLGFKQEAGNIDVSVQDIIKPETNGISRSEAQIGLAALQETDYIYYIKSGDGETFANRISYTFTGTAIEKMEVRPAVRYYYQDLVFAEQSQLGYQSSGIMLLPYIPFQDGQAEFRVDIVWELDCQISNEDYQQTVKLIQS